MITEITRISYVGSSQHTIIARICAIAMRIVDITSQILERGAIMGDFGYIYGYMLVFVACVGGLVGYIVGRWLK